MSLEALRAHRDLSLQEGGCSVPVAVHTVMSDGQVSRENGWGVCVCGIAVCT